MKKFFLILALAVCASGVVSAQEPAASHDGGISPEMLAQISATYEDNGYDRAISNALAGTSISVLALNADNAAMIDTHFSDRVKTKGITDQKSCGRCWLFTGLNVLSLIYIFVLLLYFVMKKQFLRKITFAHVSFLVLLNLIYIIISSFSLNL